MDADPIVVDGRFTVIDLIRRNPSTMTAVAVDGTSGEPVVVKAANVDQLSRATRIRLRHEAEVLHALGDSGLVPLIASGEADGLFYLAMPRVAGRTLRARRSNSTSPQARSSAATCWETADAVYPRLRAASANDPVRTTSRTVWMCRGLIIGAPRRPAALRRLPRGRPLLPF